MFAALNHPDADHSAIATALEVLSEWLHTATGERVIVLIDEYDAPLHAAWQHGYWDDALPFFRNFLSAGLKDNPHLRKAVLTGILKVAKEGIFSGLNHLQTATILTSHMANRFGFTEDEVIALADLAGANSDLATLQRWYNGYRFGRHPAHTMYNPWSVINFLAAPGSGPRAFWKNTSDNALVHTLLMRHAASVGPEVETLLGGGTIERIIDENVALTQLEANVGAVFGLLLFSGYPTATDITPTEAGVLTQLRIPNLEGRGIFADTFINWLRAGSDDHADDNPDALARALLTGAEEELGLILQQRLVAVLSYHDVGKRQVEAVYQAFLLGMLVHLQSTHTVRSNRESGFGRADVLVTPRNPAIDARGAVLELKRIVGDETPEAALERALNQLRTRNYAAEVRAAGATAVHQYGVVFDGKRCWVKMVEPA